jgi:thymidylate synthase (FAD)
MKAEYIDHMGDDLRVVNAARVSFSKESDWSDDSCLTEKDKKLISYLAKHNHWTPFSHPQITMRETVPIFVARQRFKHMVGFTYNEISRRYVDDSPAFYYPSSWRSRPEGSVKQGSGELTIDFIDIGNEGSVEINDAYSSFIDEAIKLYEAMIASGVAPEQARMVLPQSMYTGYYVTGSLAAWARAYKQRIDSHAQKEIQELAKQWDDIIRPLFPVSWEALTNDR